MSWIVYILELSDGSYYTGITNDLERRLKAHSDGNGSAYVRSRLPIREVRFVREVPSRSVASRVEAQIKGRTRAEKEKLIKEQEND